MEKVKISSPWVTYVHIMEKLFGDDRDIKLEYDEKNVKLTMRVNGNDKAEALRALIPSEKPFGNVILKINIVPANEKQTLVDLIEVALKGNPHFVGLMKIEGVSSNNFSYAIFKKEVAQYWDDNLGDPHGNTSCLYQDLAREIFDGVDGVLFCTDNKD